MYYRTRYIIHNLGLKQFYTLAGKLCIKPVGTKYPHLIKPWRVIHTLCYSTFRFTLSLQSEINKYNSQLCRVYHVHRSLCVYETWLMALFTLFSRSLSLSSTSDLNCSLEVAVMLYHLSQFHLQLLCSVKASLKKIKFLISFMYLRKGKTLIFHLFSLSFQVA